MELIEADRDRLQENVIAASGEIGVGDIRHQPELGRQHFSGSGPGSLDGPTQVEPLLHDVPDILLEHVLVERVVTDAAADENDAGAAEDRTGEPERHVDAGEYMCWWQFVLLRCDVEHQVVKVGPM